MKEYLTRWRERYAKVLRNYPELKEASNLSTISTYAASDRCEQKLQQAITAALICSNPDTFDESNICYYTLENCNTPTDKNYYTNSEISRGLYFMFKYMYSTTLFKDSVEFMEKIYFTL